uniref:Mannitol dehydrogenase n=1 Tax=Ganoderma boninense TaxID=34458 RepID=A0A5K1JW16_9APHY|nr:Mannitol dehydrogenase [Ganoderma boninense]
MSAKQATSPPPDYIYDCVVVGSGHAGSCAALAAHDAGCKRVLIVDKCPPEWVGGNGYFTAGAHRTVHGGLDDLLPLVTNVAPDAAQSIDLAPYTADAFTHDIMRLGAGRSDPRIVQAVVDGSRDAVGWLRERVRVPFILPFHRQAYLVDGRQVFWGGLSLSVEDGGKGLIAAHRAALEAAGIETWFEAPATELVVDGESKSIAGLVVSRHGEPVSLRAPAVVLACGGFEANRALRAQYLGPEWDRAKVR